MKAKKVVGLPVVLTIIICALINFAASKSAAFSDFYVSNIFPIVTLPLSFINSYFPFSVGEWVIVALCIYVALAVVFLIVYGIVCAVNKLSGKKSALIKKGLGHVGVFFARVTPVLLAIACVIMTLNCFILYHCSKVPVYSQNQEYTLQQLSELRDFVVTRCNELSMVVPRDEKGNVLYEGDMTATAISAIKALSSEYQRLSGFYTTPKNLYFSEFMCQQYMQGYYFPFSMEANINSKMSIMHKPFTMCHELAHTHGYIYEDEANLLGFLACVKSDDVEFVYSAYLGVLNYINNDFYNAVSKEEYGKHVKISEQVKYDNEFVTKEQWEEVEKNAVLKTETVKKAADTFIDTNLKVNGVAEGKVNYTRVVGLILDYYYNGPGFDS